ncbi:ATP-binding protein [uncultured Bacteroides sp.]|uniref:ATP-binding protein n=1 Tax=uncultured Bacteroides sp. TaxID=162156 RepID=UPI00272B091D|nr:hypothetical protein [uncultured Bacteroides sp.]
MGTIINSISFCNFYNYYGSYEDNTYTFTEGINIINADNNMGKSKFYNGFLWILRDEVYDSDDKKIYPVSDSYFKMMSGKARRESDELTLGVRIIFENNNERYIITKEVRCTKESEWLYNATTEVQHTIDNEDQFIMDKTEKDDVIRKLIPYDMEKYCLLQGESMERLVDLSTLKGLENTINALADMNNLIQMCSRANELVAEAKKEYKTEEKRNSSADEAILSLQRERDDCEKWIEDAKTKIALARQELARAREAEQRFESDFYSSKKREQLRHEYESEQAKLRNLQKEKEEQERSITSRLFDENCPWLLMGLEGETSDFDDFRIALTKKLAQKQIMENPDILLPEGSPDTPSLKRMLESCHCEVCDREAPKDSAPWLHIKKIMERPRKAMHSSDSFIQYYGKIQKTTGLYETTIPKIAEDYQSYMDNIFELDNQIAVQENVVEQKESEMTLVGAGNTTPEEDRKTLSGYNQAKNTIKDKDDEIQKYTRNIGIWSDKLEKIHKELDKKQNSSPVKKAGQLYNDMQCIAQMFADTKERIFANIVNNLQTVANTMYSDLTAGNQTLGGKLLFEREEGGTVRVKVVDNNGEELFGNGTGFQRMKQLAIVMSIISSKENNQCFDYPFISDAPFSEFGVKFINNFLEIAPKVFRQSIIMIKDLYDSDSSKLILPGGLEIAKRMQRNELNGTFYVNYVEEKADSSNLVTKKKCYSE